MKYVIPAAFAVFSILVVAPFIVEAQAAPTVTLTDNGQSVITAPKVGNYTVAWSSSNVSSCTLSWQGTGPNAGVSGSQGVAANQSASGPSGLIGSYTLTCTGPNGSISATAVANATGPDAPTCSMAFNPASGPPNTMSTLTWTSTNATAANIAPWGGEPVNGSIPGAHSGQTVVSVGTFTGPGGTATCTTTLGVVRPPGIDTLTLSTTTGTAPLSVNFTALANAGGSCNALTYAIAYGDGQTQEIDIPANYCQQKSFSYTHSYASAGSYTAGYYLGTPQQVAAGTATLVKSATVQTVPPPNPLAVDVFLIAGQSNALGYIPGAASVTSPSVPSGKVLQYYNGAISNANDPVGAAVMGSAWPAFGVTYYASTTGHLILFVPDAIGGSCQTPQGVQGTGGPPSEDYWSDTTSPGGFWANSVNSVKAAETALTAAGYTPTFKGVLWDQGECGAEGGVDENLITGAQYQSALAQMIAAYRVQFGSSMPFYIFRTGTHINAVDAGYAAVRQAQENISASDSNSWVVFRDAVNFPAEGLMQSDGLHYSQIGYNEMGTQGAANVVGAQHGTFSHTPPPVASSTPTATITDNGQSTITLPATGGYTVAWSSSNVSSCTLSWLGAGPDAGSSGSQSVAADQSASGGSGLVGSYTLACTGPNGSVSATATANAAQTAPPPVGSVSLTVNGTSTIIFSGGYTVAWSSSQVSSCVLSWQGTGPNAGISGSSGEAPNQSVSGGSGLIGSYTFTCIDLNGVSVSKTVTINQKSPTSVSPGSQTQSQTASVALDPLSAQVMKVFGQLIVPLKP
jgi:hypothetical protein